MSLRARLLGLAMSATAGLLIAATPASASAALPAPPPNTPNPVKGAIWHVYERIQVAENALWG